MAVGVEHTRAREPVCGDKRWRHTTGACTCMHIRGIGRQHQPGAAVAGAAVARRLSPRAARHSSHLLVFQIIYNH